MATLKQICEEMGDSYTLEEKVSKWLKQKQKEVYEYKENYQISPENIIDELLEE